MLFRSGECAGIIPSVCGIRYLSAARAVARQLPTSSTGRQRCMRNARSRRLAGAFWSAVTRHRFPEATCRRRTNAHVRMKRYAHGSRQRWGARLVSLPCRRPTATSRLHKAVTSHRTPKHARVLPNSTVVCEPHPSRPRSESGYCRFSMGLVLAEFRQPMPRDGVIACREPRLWNAAKGGVCDGVVERCSL